MKSLIRLLNLFMAFIMILCACSCSDKANSSEKEEKEWREPYIEEVKAEFIDKDGEFEYKTTDWNGPADYVIVYPQGEKVLQKTANKLKSFFDTKYGINVSVESDSSAEKEKEILIGNTNRKESENGLKENEISVKTEDNKLVFNAGHIVTVNSAVEKYIRLNPENGKTVSFDIKTDFISKALDGYVYVWGDEFEGNDIDFTKWCFEQAMDATAKMEISYDKNVVDVADGKLKMHAIRYYNPDRTTTEYRVPFAVSTLDNMNFTYGYAEIRCRLPFFSGVWPSFWTRSTDRLKGTRYKNFMAEVDIFEVFGTFDIEPGIIKWYDNGTPTFQKNLTEWNSWRWYNEDTIMQEYHTYGWEWTPEKMIMYVDGTPYQTYDIVNSYDHVDDMQGFHDPEYILFTNHIITNDSWQSGPIIENSHDNLPACFYIDYFRLYQKPGVGELYTADTNHEYPDRK